MAAPLGNRFWEARTTHGRDKLFSTPEVLADACREYFEWNEDNPLYEAKVMMAQGVPVVEYLPKMRAMTIQGLCGFLGIHHSTWDEYRNRDGFSEICKVVDQAIFRQKMEGAAADLLNSSIIVRELGLADKKDVTANVAVTEAIVTFVTKPVAE